MDLMIPLNSQSRDPLYQQIYSYIKEEIRCARIPAAARMPSTRTLAEHLKASVNPVCPLFPSTLG